MTLVPILTTGKHSFGHVAKHVTNTGLSASMQTPPVSCLPIYQDRHGSDLCEHHFANVKNKNITATKQSADMAASQSSKSRRSDFSRISKGNAMGKLIGEELKAKI